MNVEGAPAVGKTELCEALGWARSTLDRRLLSDGNFPVRKRGHRGGGWEFDLAAVKTYLGLATPAAPLAPTESPPPAPPPAEVISIAPRAEHQGEATARQRRDSLQAELMADTLRRKRGELVEAAEMRMVLSTVIAKLGQGLNGLPDVLTRRLSLPETAAPVIRQEIEDLRRAMVAELRGTLGQPEPAADG